MILVTELLQSIEKCVIEVENKSIDIQVLFTDNISKAKI